MPSRGATRRRPGIARALSAEPRIRFQEVPDGSRSAYKDFAILCAEGRDPLSRRTWRAWAFRPRNTFGRSHGMPAYAAYRSPADDLARHGGRGGRGAVPPDVQRARRRGHRPRQPGDPGFLWTPVIASARSAWPSAARCWRLQPHSPEPLVSILIPTYNRGELLASRTLPSVLRQTYPHWEAVVVGRRVHGRHGRANRRARRPAHPVRQPGGTRRVSGGPALPLDGRGHGARQSRRWSWLGESGSATSTTTRSSRTITSRSSSVWRPSTRRPSSSTAPRTGSARPRSGCASGSRPCRRRT